MEPSESVAASRPDDSSDAVVPSGSAVGPESTAAVFSIEPDQATRNDFEGEYPFRGHFLHLPATGSVRTATGESSAQTVRLHFLDEGPQDAPPLLFVHGNPTWSFAWRNLIKGLSDRFRCIAVDHIGCGRSDKPPRAGQTEAAGEVGYPYELAQHRNNLQALIETLDLRDTTLIAHDWGGAIGCSAAGTMADRFAAIVLMNTGAFPSDAMPTRIAACRWPVVGPWAVRRMNGFARAATTMAVEKPLPEIVKQGYLAPYDSYENRVAIQAFVDDIPMSPSHPSWDTLKQCEEKLPNLASKRVLLPWGEQDWCFTTDFRDRFVAHFPSAIVQNYPAAGHYVFEDAGPELLVTLNAFLRL